ncbi:hypothetical protein BME69_04945 [Klebsiella quasipneumoniae subsp. quasipneumoniae]|nr:hypothetical protein BME69_04945 [Klebsiella quasipneumoniae subsp. quasipneumoniae]
MTDGAVHKGEKRPRPCGLIYQQSTSGMIPEGLGMLNKKNPLKAGRNTKGKSDGAVAVMVPR